MENTVDRVREQWLIDQLIDDQKKRFVAAYNKEGKIYFEMIKRLITEGTVKPPKDMTLEQFMQAYDEAAIKIGESQAAKSRKKNQ